MKLIEINLAEMKGTVIVNPGQIVSLERAAEKGASTIVLMSNAKYYSTDSIEKITALIEKAPNL